MNAEAKEINRIRWQSAAGCVLGILSMILIPMVTGFVGSVIAIVLFFGSPMMILLGFILSLMELWRIKKGRISNDVALPVLGIVCCLIASGSFIWLLMWIAAA